MHVQFAESPIILLLFFIPIILLIDLKRTHPNILFKHGTGTMALITVFHAIFKQSYAKCHIEL